MREVVFVHDVLEQSFGRFVSFGNVELVGFGESRPFSFEVEFFVVGLNLIDSKKRGVIVHELLDLAPVSKTPEFQSVEQVDFIEYGPG
jgi:hypothetical protein